MSNLVMLLAMGMAGLDAPAALDGVWSFTAEGPAATGMVVAEVHPAPGPETVFVDTGTGSVVCIGADGDVLWTWDGHFFSEDTAPLAATTQAGDRNALILVQDDDHTVIALDGATGDEAWRFDVPGLGAARLHWADLDDDDRAEALVLAPEYGIVAIESDGRVAWEAFYEDLRGEGPLLGALAAGDATGDFFGEVAGARGDTVFLLDNLGFPLWEEALGGRVAAGPLLFAAGLDTPGALVVATSSPDALVQLDAASGTVGWEAPLPAAVVPGGLAVVHLRAGGPEGIAVADEAGRVSLFDLAGEKVWTGELPDGSGATLLAGDLAGDGWTELIAVNPAGTLHHIANGRIEGIPAPSGTGRLQAGLALLADTDHAALVLNRGEAFEALTRHGRTYSALLPWALEGGDAGRSRQYRRSTDFDDIRWVEERVALDAPGWPRGAEDGTEVPEAWEIAKGAGTFSFEEDFLVVVPEDDGGTVVVAGPAADLPPFTAALTVEPVDGGMLEVVWEDEDGRVLLIEAVGDTALHPPYGAARYRLRLGAGAALRAEAPGVEALTRTLPRAGIFYNVLGYDANGAKHFTAWTNFVANSYRFHLQDSSGNNVYSGSFAFAERVAFPEGRDWGAHYWRGDFSDLLDVGTFRLAAEFDGVTVQSPPFVVEVDRMWDVLFAPVYGSLNTHRCDNEDGLPCAPGDDVPAGFWRKGTDPGVLDSARTVLRLADMFLMTRWRFEPAGQLNAFGQGFRDDILEAARALVGAREHYEAGEQEVREGFGAALAKAVRTVDGEDEALLEAARTAVDAALAGEAPGPLAFGAAMDLFILTGDEAYEAAVVETYPGPNLLAPEGVVEYEIQIDEMSMTSLALMQFLNREAESLMTRAANPFGVYLPADAESVDSAALLEAAGIVAQALRFQPRAPFRAFVQSQLDWLLGNNPLGAVLIQGVGPDLPWSLADRDGPWEGVPGLVADALYPEGPGGVLCLFCPDGAAASTGIGYSLETGLHLLDAVAHMKRVRR